MVAARREQSKELDLLPARTGLSKLVSHTTRLSSSVRFQIELCVGISSQGFNRACRTANEC